MSIEGPVRKCLKDLEQQISECSKRIRFTSGERTPEAQLKIVLEPRNASNYPNIKAAFRKEFQLASMPSFDDVKQNKGYYGWWIKNINRQAGKVGGFAHVGGNAQDIEVVKLTKDEREALEIALAGKGFKVLYEYVVGTTSKFKGVSIKKATTFHVYKGSPPRLIA